MLTTKSRQRNNLYPSLDVKEYPATKDEEKPEVLHAFFTSVFKSENGYSLGNWPPVLVDRVRE